MKRLTMSLKTKITIGVCLVVAGITAAVALLSLSYFQQQLRENVAAQQFVLISSIAGHIDDNLVAAQNELVAMSKSVPLDILLDADRAQSFLDIRPENKTTFDNSVILFSSEGTLIAETPFVPGRRGKDFSFRDYFKKTMMSGKPCISEPIFSTKQHRHPLVVLTAPLFNTAGEVVGMLAGSVDLTNNNFLGKLAHVPIGKRGYLYLFDTERTLVMHPDERRILKQDVPLGVNLGFDKAIAGFDGTIETVNSKGLPMLATFKHLNATNWILAANFPQAEAYAAIDKTKRILVAALFAAIALSVGVVWFFLKHLTAPLQRFADHVRSFTGKLGAERLFANASGDEIDVLANAFNGMVKELDNEREALRESEERFRQIAEHCSEVFFVVSSDLRRTIYISPAYETLWQQSCQSLYDLPSSFADIIHEEDRPRVFSALEQQAHGEIFDQVYRIVRSDRTVCWIHARTYPVRAENGEVYRYVGIAEDVTKQKLVEEQIRKLHQAVEQSPVTIIITDCVGSIEYVNPKFTQLTGHSYLEAVGQNPRILKSGETSAGIYHQMWETITAGGEWHGEMLNRKKNGELFWESAVISPIKNPAGEITHYLGVKEDITARKEADKELEQAHAQLKATHIKLLQQEKMASIGQLAAGVAHEINNPIGFVSSNLGTIDKYVSRMTEFIALQTEKLASLSSPEIAVELDSKRQSLKLDYIMKDFPHVISESLDGTERVSRIVQSLKSFSRLDEAECKYADINECLESTINIVWNEIKYKATLKKELGIIPLIKCYPQQLNQVFMNLLVNASHAIDKQGEITVGTSQEDDFISVTIADTGCGIPEEIQRRIFEPFFTTKDVGKGTGLGLSISYDIIKKHDGDISVESEVGSGTTFTVRLPHREATV